MAEKIVAIIVRRKGTDSDESDYDNEDTNFE